jgi:hypothetical protein
LKQADSGLREAIRAELADVGEEIVTRAQANAPRHTGIMASKIICYFGTRAPRKSKGVAIGTQIRDVKWKDGRIRFEAMPTGQVAHLMERGVNASFYQRPGRRQKEENKVHANSTRRVTYLAQGPYYPYARTLNIAPRPFFMPAVDAVGGAAGVNSRLQEKIDQLAQQLNERGA